MLRRRRRIGGSVESEVIFWPTTKGHVVKPGLVARDAGVASLSLRTVWRIEVVVETCMLPMMAAKIDVSRDEQQILMT